ncbi:MAG: methylmalonyl-CoA mutase, partial [Acidimicrobiales bacterium]
MFDDPTLARSRELAEEWGSAYGRMVDKFGDQAPARAARAATHSGLPLKPAYFPHDIEHLDLGAIAAPGSYPFTRGNL